MCNNKISNFHSWSSIKGQSINPSSITVRRRRRRRRRKRTHIYRSLRSLHLLYGRWAALLGTRLSIGEASNYIIKWRHSKQVKTLEQGKQHFLWQASIKHQSVNPSSITVRRRRRRRRRRRKRTHIYGASRVKPARLHMKQGHPGPHLLIGTRFSIFGIFCVL